MRRLLTILLLLGGLVLPAGARALDVPPAAGYVNDRADILSPDAERTTEKLLRDFDRTDSTQVVVLTVPSLEGEPVESFALRVAEAWGIGQKGKDNGALLLIATKDRKMRIEVGYGLEGRLTDLLAGRIIDREIAPRFRAGDFDGGVLAGATAIVQAVRGEYQGTGQPYRKRERTPWGMLALLLFLGPGLMLLRGGRRSRFSHHHRGGYWVGGPFGGGGGFSGGGGGFGGGGSSGGW